MRSEQTESCACLGGGRASLCIFPYVCSLLPGSYILTVHAASVIDLPNMWEHFVCLVCESSSSHVSVVLSPGCVHTTALLHCPQATETWGNNWAAEGASTKTHVEDVLLRGHCKFSEYCITWFPTKVITCFADLLLLAESCFCEEFLYLGRGHLVWGIVYYFVLLFFESYICHIAHNSTYMTIFFFNIFLLIQNGN